MKKTEEISSFFYSQYFAEGLRITLGSIIPIIVCAFLGEFMTGTMISLGALIVGLSDTPGAPSHRQVGMVYCTLLSIMTIVITALANDHVGLMTIVIAVLSFLFSMFAVFNARGATVGTMCILIMLINVDDTYTLREELGFLVFFITGAAWYMIISFSLNKVRPYRLAQQEISETILQVADYLRLKAKAYDPRRDLDENYIKLIEKQVAVNDHQEKVRDILFQSKRSIKDTTKEGRYLTLIFTDIVDLFEQSMTTHYDYESIRTTYANTPILDLIRNAIYKISHELDHIAYRINANKLPKALYDFDKEIERIRTAVEEYDQTNGTNSIALKKIIINVRTIIKHIRSITHYSQFKGVDLDKENVVNTQKFIKTDIINWQSFKDNLSLESSNFRHAIRMSLVLSITYLIFNLLGYSLHSIYWILLTIMVILKPGFGLTKERNLQRLIGTVIGGIIGAVILLLIPDLTVRFILLIFFFLTAYSLFRINYIVAVVFMTPYVLILLSFTGVNTIEMAQERIVDTLIGGSIAFISNYVILPNWESIQIKSNIHSLLSANHQYLAQAIQVLSGKKLEIIDYKLARKEVYIASANMGSTFQRLLTEPSWRQKLTKEINRFVILNHIFSSYSATLMTQIKDADIENFNHEHVKLLNKALINLEKSIALIDEDTYPDSSAVSSNEIIHTPHSDSDESKLITEQLEFIVKISSDIQKITTDLVQKAKNHEEQK